MLTALKLYLAVSWTLLSGATCALPAACEQQNGMVPHSVVVCEQHADGAFFDSTQP
jgi:hypothetical protein